MSILWSQGAFQKFQGGRDHLHSIQPWHSRFNFAKINLNIVDTRPTRPTIHPKQRSSFIIVVSKCFEAVLLNFQAPSSRSKGLGEATHVWEARGAPKYSTATFRTQAAKLGDYSRISQLASYRLTWQPAGSVACGARQSQGALD